MVFFHPKKYNAASLSINLDWIKKDTQLSFIFKGTVQLDYNRTVGLLIIA